MPSLGEPIKVPGWCPAPLPSLPKLGSCTMSPSPPSLLFAVCQSKLVSEEFHGVT